MRAPKPAIVAALVACLSVAAASQEPVDLAVVDRINATASRDDVDGGNIVGEIPGGAKRDEIGLKIGDRARMRHGADASAVTVNIGFLPGSAAFNGLLTKAARQAALRERNGSTTTCASEAIGGAVSAVWPPTSQSITVTRFRPSAFAR